MGRVKAWLMDMEEDATILSADEFKKQHGKEHIYIWEKTNGPETPPDEPGMECPHKTVLMTKLNDDLVCEDCGEDVTEETNG